MKIYTHQGDLGTTKTINGKEVNKSEPLLNALGSLDECNSLIGLLASYLKSQDLQSQLQKELENRQKELLKCGTILALSGTTLSTNKSQKLTEQEVLELEEQIDIWQKGLPELKNFILPGGTMAAALAHHARSVCRRAERDVVTVNRSQKLDPLLLKYLNRLSDWLFVLARKLNDGLDLIWR